MTDISQETLAAVGTTAAPVSKTRSRQIWKRLRRVIAYVGIVWVILVFVFPLWVALDTSVKPVNQQRTFPTSLLSTRPTLEKYAKAFGPLNFPHYMGNTVLVAGVTTLLAVSVGSLAGYALSRFRFRGHTFFSRTILLMYMFPPMLLLIPLYMLLTSLKIRDSLWALIVCDTTFALPFAIWMLKSFFDTVPRELDEAALIDGCSLLGALLRVVLPVSVPGVIATAVFSFMLAWGEYLFAVTLITTQGYQPISVAVYALMQPFALDPGMLMAVSVISAVPPIIFFFLAQKWIVQGLTAGAVKG